MTIDCPNAETCGGELTFDVYMDSDGDDAWSQWFITAELDSQTCGCEFSDAQMTILEQRAAEMSFEASAPDI